MTTLMAVHEYQFENANLIVYSFCCIIITNGCVHDNNDHYDKDDDQEKKGTSKEY